MTSSILLTATISVLFVACDDTASSKSEVAAVEETVHGAANKTEMSVALPRSESAAGARVFFITPSDGATLSSPLEIEFGVAEMEVVKAGNNQPHSGHHHLLINTGVPELGLPIPADESHIHFGDGSTSTTISLPPGEHTLQMLLGDYIHIPHNPALVSESITITVE